MNRNVLRVVCNSDNNCISYFFKNENGTFNPLSDSSPLSRKYYTYASLKDRAKEIISMIDEIYNRKNRGVDIIFEGSKIDYDFFEGTINYYFSDKDIKVIFNITRIVVVGKKNVGKTSLIEGMGEYSNNTYTIEKDNNFNLYKDDNRHIEWYEIDGIDLGLENIEKAYSTVEVIQKRGISSIVYCVSAMTGRIEKVEIDFINKLMEKYPNVIIVLALTMSVSADNRNIFDEIQKNIERITVVPILAKEYEIEIDDEETGDVKQYVKEAFGLDHLTKCIFEGR